MNKSVNKTSQSKAIFAYGIVFVLLFFLCMLFPYTGDDWNWGSYVGLDRLAVWFDNFSGRYFGNLIVIALTRSNLLKSFAMSFCITGIVFLLNRLTGRQKNSIFIISSVLLFMPIPLLRQAVVWTSGFANYTTSIFLTLIYIYYVNSIYDEKEPKNSFAAAIPLALLGFANTLIVEHMTIYNVILAIYVIVLILIKFRKFFVQHIAYFIGTIAGTTLMFSNSVYRSISNGSDYYRTIGGVDGNIFTRVVDAYFGTIVSEGFFNNFVLNAFLVGMCLVVWFRIKYKLSKKSKRFGLTAITVMTAFAVFSLIVNICGFGRTMPLKRVICWVTSAYIIAFIIFLSVLPFDFNRKLKLLFILGSTGCMIAPLLVVTPIGSRCFFGSYVMMLYLAMEFYSLFDDDIKEKSAKISKIAVIMTIAGLIYLFSIYGTITHYNNDRVEKAQQDAQSGADIIYVEKLPYSNYLWHSDLKDNLWKNGFKRFYGIDENIKIEQLP